MKVSIKSIGCVIALTLVFSTTGIHPTKAQNIPLDGFIQAIEQILNTLVGDGCITGGEGSSSCRLSVEVNGGVSVLGNGSNGGVSVTYTTSCQEGYYACCNLVGARCARNQQ